MLYYFIQTNCIYISLCPSVDQTMEFLTPVLSMFFSFSQSVSLDWSPFIFFRFFSTSDGQCVLVFFSSYERLFLNCVFILIIWCIHSFIGYNSMILKHIISHCMFKKIGTILYDKLLHKMDQDFLDIQYVCLCGVFVSLGSTFVKANFHDFKALISDISLVSVLFGFTYVWRLTFKFFSFCVFLFVIR